MSDRLRDAARVLRDRACAVEPDYHSRRDWYEAKTLVRRLPTSFAQADAAFIATMHPAVAAALADWLDLAALTFDDVSGWPADSHKRAWPCFAIADAILGSSDD